MYLLRHCLLQCSAVLCYGLFIYLIRTEKTRLIFLAGLQYDVNQHTLKGEVFNAGLHAGPPGYKFIIFPRVYKTIQFTNVKCLNKDGLTITLSIQFQYLVSLKKEDLKKIILEFKDHETYKTVVT